MIGISGDFLEIQENFLKFEVGYNNTKGLFDEVLRRTKQLSNTRVVSINRRTYNIADKLVDLSVHYLDTKLKIEGTQTKGEMDKWLKDDILKMIEGNMSSLAKIESSISKLLKEMVGVRLITEGELASLLDLEKEEKPKDGVVFVSKYDKIAAKDSEQYLTRWFLSKCIRACILMFAMFVFLLITNTGVVSKISSSLSSFVIQIFNASPPDSEHLSNSESFSGVVELGPKAMSTDSLNKLVAPITNLISVIIGGVAFILIWTQIIQFLVDLVYVTIPISREFLSKFNGIQSLVDTTLLDQDIVIQKYKLTRAIEIVAALKGVDGLTDTHILKNLEVCLNKIELDSVLSMEDTYAIILAEAVYNLVNSMYKKDKDTVIDVLDMKKSSINPIAMRVTVLGNRIRG